MHLNSRLLFEQYALPHLAANQHILEIGPDAIPSTYERAVAHLAPRWESADIAGPLARAHHTPGAWRPVATDHAMPTEYEIPIPDATFDVVVAGQVIEHVRRVWVWIREVARVTKPGGKIILISPISWPYHEAPVDCWRIYPEGMRTLCAEASLTVLTCEMDSLEPPMSRRQYLGDSYYLWHPTELSLPTLTARVKQLVGWPTPTALDLVTVAQKA